MVVETLSTGEELQLGAVTDTNAGVIAMALTEQLGLTVSRHSRIGDDAAGLTGLLTEIAGRAHVCIVTGGLGPTSDDVTACAAADAAQVPLKHSDNALASIRRYFEKRGRCQTQRDTKQAKLPEGAVCLHNDIGTAPGFRLDIASCRFFFLPGVPREMTWMLETHVIGAIASLLGPDHPVTERRQLTVFGLPEAGVNERLRDLRDAVPGIQVGYRAVFPEIQVKLVFQDIRADRAREKADAAAVFAARQLGPHLVSDTGASLPEALGKTLTLGGKTLAVAESCTGGLIGHLLTGVAGSSDYFLLSAVTYANSAKQRVLGVSTETLDAWGAVSEAVIREMAEGVKALSGADYGLATSGIAGPGGGSPEKPVGTVWIGVAGPDPTLAEMFQIDFRNRRMNKRVFAYTALDRLRRMLDSSV
ncbi:MAG: damage-inducible protein CinA [Deltaproteobacteria bacterium]|nr:MAG: damage-inducible protein CinA [Deltaproteobacteria bacterium]